VDSISDIGQIEIHKAEPLVPDPSPFQVETATAKLKKYKSSGSNQISAEMIQAGGETLWSEIHKLFHSTGIKKNCLISGTSLLLLSIYNKGNKTDSSNYRGILLLSTSYKIYPLSFSQV
jgi:hypothetical protein